MNRLNTIWHSWKQDRLLGAVIKNTGYLFSANTIAMGLTAIQGFLVAALLSPSAYGLLYASIQFASSVNRLLSFRMGELVIKYAGQDLAIGNQRRAAAVIKVAGLAEAVTSVVAYLVLLLLSPLAARYILHDPNSVTIINLYGLILLANLMTETSTAVLQVGNHYRSQALLNLAASVTTAGLIVAAFFLKGGFMFILVAYLAGKFILGIGIMVAAFRWLKPMLGENWWQAPIRLIPDKRVLVRFAISTNLSGTVNTVFRDSETLWASFFLGTTAAGYYRFAYSVVMAAITPINPLTSTVYPEISRFVARHEWKPLKSLLKRTTLLASAWTAGCGLLLLTTGYWLLTLFKHGAYLPSFAGMLVLLIGYGVASVLFWNRSLLLAFGKPNEPLFITALVGAAKTGLMFVLVRPFGYLAQAGLLSVYFAVSVVWIVALALRELRKNEQISVAEVAA
jgi:O-antigen/teichoic acid export membrane protein